VRNRPPFLSTGEVVSPPKGGPLTGTSQRPLTEERRCFPGQGVDGRSRENRFERPGETTALRPGPTALHPHPTSIRPHSSQSSTQRGGAENEAAGQRRETRGVRRTPNPLLLASDTKHSTARGTSRRSARARGGGGLRPQIQSPRTRPDASVGSSYVGLQRLCGQSFDPGVFPRRRCRYVVTPSNEHGSCGCISAPLPLHTSQPLEVGA
jgi:hypothetical protein